MATSIDEAHHLRHDPTSQQFHIILDEHSYSTVSIGGGDQQLRIDFAPDTLTPINVPVTVAESALPPEYFDDVAEPVVGYLRAQAYADGYLQRMEDLFFSHNLHYDYGRISAPQGRGEVTRLQWRDIAAQMKAIATYFHNILTAEEKGAHITDEADKWPRGRYRIVWPQKRYEMDRILNAELGELERHYDNELARFNDADGTTHLTAGARISALCSDHGLIYVRPGVYYVASGDKAPMTQQEKEAFCRGIDNIWREFGY